ncbi:MAG: DegT/DnrJ/EryC1/StrS family aminotransferase [Pseudomonadota bacterium]
MSIVSRKSVPLSRPDHPDDPAALLNTLREIVLSGRWTEGEYAKSFEQHVAEDCGSIYAVAANSGTSALEMICEAAEFGEDDEIICPSYTFIATVNAVLGTGAKPVFADIDPLTFNLDLNDVERKLSPKTKGVVLVHQFGIPSDGRMFQEFCKAHHLVLIEDAACGLGSKVRGKCVGTFGLAGLLSFHPRKVLSTGEGGMILTDDEALATRARSIGNHGRSEGAGRTPVRVGHNYRMSEFQAALGLWALDHVAEAVARRVAAAHRYEQALRDVKQTTLIHEPSGTEWNRQSYPVRVPGEVRNLIMEALQKDGIETSPGPLPANLHPFIEHMLHPPRLPETERAHAETILLPMYAAITAEDQERVAASLKLAFRRIVG